MTEKLIEEAYRHGRMDEKYSLAYAPPVFEKAHTPTDDEVDAMAYLITAHRFRERGLNGAIGELDIAVTRPLAEFLHREGFRRTEIPEPSAEDDLNADYDARLGDGDRDDPEPQGDELTRERDHHGIDPEPQGEPSDDYEAGYAEGFQAGLSSPRGTAEDDRAQGEPSDAAR